MTKAAETQRSLPRRLFFPVIAVLLVFLTLELCLRAAGAALLLHTHWTADREADLYVWAFGDSNTFGIGADDPGTQAFPAVVGRLLEERTGSQSIMYCRGLREPLVCNQLLKINRKKAEKVLKRFLQA